MANFEQVACLFNHAAPAVHLFERPDWWYELPGIFSWYQCPECDLLFLNPRPTLESIVEYYPSSYPAYSLAIDDERWLWLRWKRRRNLHQKIEGVHRHIQGGRLLDIGCATGNYLVEMRRLGWQVWGVELQEEAAAYARQRFDLDVFTGDLLKSQLPDHYFDVVTMWDVLEHVHNPLSILTKVCRVLKPGGLLVFSLPDPTSREAQSFGPDWIGYDAPRHLYLFSGKSLQLLLSQSGFRLLATDHLLATYHTWVASWQTQLNRQISPGHFRSLLTKVAHLPIWSSVTAPYFNWLNRTGRGSVITVYTQALPLS